MAQAKQNSKRKRRKTALVLGAAGVSLTMAGGASATAPETTVASQGTAAEFFLAEEEISDVSLATFYVFDKENQSALREGVKLAAGRGCGGGCGGCRGCGGCAAHGCAAHGCAAHGCAALGAARGCAALGAARGCATHGTMAPLGTTRGTMALRTMGPSGMHHHRHHGRGCRGCRGCGCGVAVWIGGCSGCDGDYTSCWQWDPVQGQWVYVCE